MVLFFLLLYPLLPGSWGYHIGFLAFIPSPFGFCGYRILFLTPIPAAARLLGVSWFPSLSHTRCCMTSGGIILAFSLSYPLLPDSWGYHIGFLAFIPTISDNIYTIRYLPQITLTLNERFCLHNSGNIRR